MPGNYKDIPKEILKGTALASLIFFMALGVPVFGFIFALFLPLPVFFYGSKLGTRYRAYVPCITAVIIMFTLGKASFDMLFFAELLFLGFVLSHMIEKGLCIEKTILYTCGLVLGGGIFCLVLYSNAANIDFGVMISEYVSENLKMTMLLYEKMGMAEDNLMFLSEIIDKIHYALVRIIPSLVVSSVLILTWTTLLLAKPVFKSRGLYYPDFGSLNLWKPPEILVWGVIGSSVMLMIPDLTVKIFGLNGLIILMTVYFLGGIAIVSYYFEKKQVPLMFRFFLYSLIGLWQVLMFLVIGLGFFDMWLNFRKLEIKKE
ncbi:DUF2232 domain-containing protein [Desulfonema limicola]|uniref:DUF2232 domain-containing protein n=1 Tax=Desulfonema limicola TaxID=45656 RepID=UPI001A9BE3FF|nr:DUF2232 domain-containing protein [Desulfonema limicola]